MTGARPRGARRRHRVVPRVQPWWYVETFAGLRALAYVTQAQPGEPFLVETRVAHHHSAGPVDLYRTTHMLAATTPEYAIDAAWHAAQRDAQSYVANVILARALIR